MTIVATEYLGHGTRVRHKRTGGLYTVSDAAVLAKLADNLDWHKAVIYQQDITNAVFVRDLVTFRRNFEVVK